MNIMMNIVKISTLIILTATSFCFAGDDEKEPLELVHSDRFISSAEQEDKITNLIGNVHLKHGSTDLKSDRAVWYKETNVIVFLDSVYLIDSLRTLTCRTLTYYRNSGSAMAVGEVEIRDKIEQVLLKANKVDYFKEEDRFIATGGPVFKLYPDDDSSRITIVGDSIIYNGGSKTGEAVNNVIISRRNMTAECDKAEFYDSGERIVLLGNPTVVHDDNLIEGETIELFIKDKSLTGIIVEKDASATYRSQPDTSVEQYTEAVLTGKQLEAFFSDEKLYKTVMRRNAVSVYTPAATDTLAEGKNTASGDSISLFFDDSGIYRVLVLGGAQGHYTENKIQEDGKIKPDTTYYDAREIDYLVNDKMIILFDNAKLRYEAMILKSGRITYNINENIMIATGFTAETDSGEVLVQTPVLKEGSDELFGSRMVYNIKTRKGKVELGETELEDGFFRGSELRQVEKDVLFVTSGKYTTCDLEEPHFHFHCKKMKMVTKDKVIARPVILFIGPIPVMAIPYYIFPIKKGRRSGFLTFEISNIEKGNRFIRNLGYYWAASDYWDLQSSLDYDENRSVRLNSAVKYALRNKLTGNIRGSFTRQTSWNTTSYSRQIHDGWGINFSHNQTLSETMSLRAGGAFQSNKNYNIDNSYDQEERLRRTVRANASLSKRFESSSVTIAVNQDWNLDTDVKTRLLPTISFSRKSQQIFPPSSKRKESKRILPWEEQPEKAEDKWYNSIYFRVTSNFQNRHHLSKKSEILDWEKYKTLNSTYVLSSPQNIFGVLTVSPSATFKQTFYKIDQVHSVDTIDIKTDDYFRREVWSSAVSAKTDLYGTIYPNIFYVSGLRHVITPSASFNYAPETKRNEKYYSFTGVGSSSSKKKNISFGLSNLFQIKIRSGEQEKKFDLFDVKTLTSYDFEKETKRWARLSNSINSRALRIVTLSLGTTHDFYDENTDKFLRLDPRLVDLSVSMTFSRKFYIFSKKSETDSEDEFERGDKDRIRLPEQESAEGGENKTTLQVNLTHRYTERYSLGRVTSETRWLDASFDLQLTTGWHIKFNTRYDLEKNQTEYPKFELTRDIHCWSGEFTWRPSGPLTGYYFRIYIKELPDIKVEQSVGGVKGGPSRF